MKKASAAKNSKVPALFYGVCDLSSQVVGLHSVGRLTSGQFCRVCLGTGDFLRPQGAIPSGFTTSVGGVIAWHLRRPKKWNADLKNGLVPYSCVGGTHR